MAMTKTEILELLVSGELSVEEAGKLLPKETTPGRLSCKVSVKGAVSVYGLNSQMPCTLYADQWERLLAGCPEDHFVLAFIREHEGKPFSSTGTVDGKPKTPYTATIKRK